MKSGAGSSRLTIDELMKAIGTNERWDPIPISQYRTLTDKRYPHWLRVWAWIASKTLGNRSEYCIDQTGRELHLNHAAADLDLDLAIVRRAWARLERENRVKKDGSKLRICARITLPRVDEVDDPKGSYSPIAPYIAEQLRKQHSEEEQECFKAKFEHIRRRFKALHAELVRAVRAIAEEEQDDLFREFGLKRNHQHKRQPRPTEAITAIRPLHKMIVQSSDRTVQTEDADLYESSKSAVPSPCSLLEIEDIDKGKTLAATPLSTVASTCKRRFGEEDIAAAAAVRAAQSADVSTTPEDRGEAEAVAHTIHVASSNSASEPQSSPYTAEGEAVYAVETGNRQTAQNQCGPRMKFEVAPSEVSQGVEITAAVNDKEAIAQVCARCAELNITLPDEATALQVYRKFSPYLDINNLPKVRPDQHSAGLWLRVTHQHMAMEAKRLEHPELIAHQTTERDLRQRAERDYIIAGLQKMRGGVS